MRILDLGVEAAHVIEELEHELEAHLLGRRIGPDFGQERLGIRNVDFLGNSARRELGEERVQTADHPGALTSEIAVALGEQPEHLAVIGRLDRTQRRCPQGGDGDRMCIVRVVLVGTPGAEYPDPRGQGGRDVEDLLALGHELLGQQVAHAADGLNGPGALLEWLGPAQAAGQPGGWSPAP